MSENETIKKTILAILEDPFRIHADLTEKQRTAMKWSAFGLYRDQIGAIMGIAPGTVGTHITVGCRKIGLSAHDLTWRVYEMLRDATND